MGEGGDNDCWTGWASSSSPSPLPFRCHRPLCQWGWAQLRHCRRTAGFVAAAGWLWSGGRSLAGLHWHGWCGCQTDRRYAAETQEPVRLPLHQQHVTTTLCNHNKWSNFSINKTSMPIYVCNFKTPWFLRLCVSCSWPFNNVNQRGNQLKRKKNWFYWTVRKSVIILLDGIFIHIYYCNTRSPLKIKYKWCKFISSFRWCLQYQIFQTSWLCKALHPSSVPVPPVLLLINQAAFLFRNR